MKTVYLISPKTIKENTLIDENVDETFILQAIKDAQITLREYIGKNIYNNLCSMVSGETPWVEEYKTLLDDYIQTWLCYQVSATICVPLNYKLRQQGVVQANDQHYVTTNHKDMESVVSHYAHLADHYLMRIGETILAANSVFDVQCGCGLYTKALTNHCPLHFRK